MGAQNLHPPRTGLGTRPRKVTPKEWFPNRKARRKAGYVRGLSRPGDTITYAAID